MACPDLTWNQIFFELDNLSRSGHVWIKLEGRGIYMINLAAEEATKKKGGTV